MGFLVKLYQIISALILVVPKLWPVIKYGLSKIYDHLAFKRVKEKQLEELKKATEEAEKNKDTTKLENLIGSGDSVAKVSSEMVQPEALAASPESSIEEKKKTLENQEILEAGGEGTSSSFLSTGLKIAAAGIGVYVLSSLFKKNEAKAASMSFASTSSGVILDGAGTKKNYVTMRSNFRMGSKLIP